MFASHNHLYKFGFSERSPNHGFPLGTK